MDYSATHCLEDRNTNTHLQEDRKIQENKVDSSDNLGETITAASYLDGSVNDPDVPDFITSVEIGPDSINYYSSFQVSPDHSTGKIKLAWCLGLIQLCVWVWAANVIEVCVMLMSIFLKLYRLWRFERRNTYWGKFVSTSTCSVCFFHYQEYPSLPDILHWNPKILTQLNQAEIRPGSSPVFCSFRLQSIGSNWSCQAV